MTRERRSASSWVVCSSGPVARSSPQESARATIRILWIFIGIPLLRELVSVEQKDAVHPGRLAAPGDALVAQRGGRIGSATDARAHRIEERGRLRVGDVRRGSEHGARARIEKG